MLADGGSISCTGDIGYDAYAFRSRHEILLIRISGKSCTDSGDKRNLCRCPDAYEYPSAGKEELLLITGENDVGSAVRKCFENPGLEMLVLKDGSRGSRLYTRCAPDPDTAESTDELKVCQIDAYKIEQKDPTGCRRLL